MSVDTKSKAVREPVSELEAPTTPLARLGKPGLIALCLFLPTVVAAGCLVLFKILGDTPVFVGPPIVSPDGRYAARVTMRPGGATSELSTTVALMVITPHPTRDEPRVEVLTGSLHACEVIIEWRGTDDLVISYPRDADADVRTGVWESVTVSANEREITSNDILTAYQSPDIPTCAARWMVRP